MLVDTGVILSCRCRSHHVEFAINLTKIITRIILRVIKDLLNTANLERVLHDVFYGNIK
jgi:hypothetical protein